MTGASFRRIVETAFAPFLKDLGFAPGNVTASGRAYSARFKGPRHDLLVSYEPGDKYLLILVSPRRSAGRGHLGENAAALRLGDLNRRYMNQVSNLERENAKRKFASIVSADGEERRLLKAATELFLVLPRYLALGATPEKEVVPPLKPPQGRRRCR